MGQLERIGEPADLDGLISDELAELAEEIRQFLVENVSKTGGHLGPNLGVVELTIALHRVFRSPKDSIVFDTGHQSYVHKILTGRKDFTQLRRSGGLSGYPQRCESRHDVVENSHASTALSWADGISKGNLLAGRADAQVVAVVGDGALTGGMAWEALNNIADGTDQNLVIVVNDNGRSYAPTIGGLAHHLDALRTTKAYENILTWGKRTLHKAGKPGRVVYDTLHGLKKGVKDVIAPQGMFEDIGIKYMGPVDGHDIVACEFALRRAKEFHGPVIVHVITEKGRGYQPALDDVADRFHAVGAIHPETGLPVVPARFGYTSVFSEEIVEIARRRHDIVALTAAMLEPVGLGPFQREFPHRVFDVGIAEQHAVTAAAGLSFAGMHPVVAVYATFLNRSYDQVLMDVALHGQPVTIVLDRAGITGDDGASHNGMWDMAVFSTVPGVAIAAPRDEATLRAALREAVDVKGPTVVRYPKGSLPQPIAARYTLEGVDVTGEFDGEQRVLIVALGSLAGQGLAIAEALHSQGIGSLVVDPRWVMPINPQLVRLASTCDLVIHLEDGLLQGGIGSALREALAAGAVATPLRTYGVPKEFLPHATRGEILEQLGLVPARVAREVAAVLAASGSGALEAETRALIEAERGPLGD